MRRGSLILLVIAVLTFAISAVVAFQRHKQTADIISLSGKTTAWTLVRLESEYLKFMQLLHQFALGDLSEHELQQRFDILWSRTDILLIGSESQELRRQQGVEELIRHFQGTLAELEPVVLQLEPGRTPAYLKIRDRLDPFYEPFRQIVVDNFRGVQAHFSLQKADQIQQEISFYLLGLLFSGTALIGLVLHEGKKNRQLALHDGLTGLANRLKFSNYLSTALIQAKRERKSVAVHVIDLNGFKEINDTLGHAVGDALLQQVAATLRSQLRPHDLVARLGGDEFALIQTSVENADAAASLSERIATSIRREIQVLGNSCFVSASIGISLFPQDCANANQLLTNADMAMYRAKTGSAGDYRFFEPEMNAIIQRRKLLSDDLRRALASDRLKLVYQPIMDLRCGRICAVEALLRWQHDKFGPISPLEIIPIAELYGLASQLNEWVLHTACAQNRTWQQQGLPPIQVAVNISPSMYTLGQLNVVVARVLRQTGLQGHHLVLEVTEDTTMRDIEATPDILKALRQLGVELALDDFGTGHSSLSHLKQLPVQKLKIDKSFIRDLERSPEDIRFIRTIIGLGESLGMQVIAEGIETLEQRQQMEQEGCEMGQGYHFYRPMDAAAITQLLHSQQPAAESAP